MTIMNEAVRLFFAVSALILVAMLSTPMGGLTDTSREVTVNSMKSDSMKIESTAATGVRKLANVDKKVSAKKISKYVKASRKIARRG